MPLSWNEIKQRTAAFGFDGEYASNDFPWPKNLTEKQKQAVEAAAQKVLDTRALFPNSSLADLYDPSTMPPELVKAHQGRDKAVDLCYRSAAFTSETKRIEFLFELYDKYTSGMFAGEEKKGKGKGKGKKVEYTAPPSVPTHDVEGGQAVGR